MEVTKTGLRFFSVACVWACLMATPAIASEKGLAFKGAMVNGGCNTLGSFEQVRQGARLVGLNLQRAPDPELFRTACGKQNLPLEARYVERALDKTNGRTGVVTLTYQ